MLPAGDLLLDLLSPKPRWSELAPAEQQQLLRALSAIAQAVPPARCHSILAALPALCLSGGSTLSHPSSTVSCCAIARM